MDIRLVEHVHLPDRTEGERRYSKVCQVKLLIEPTKASARQMAPVTLTYSVNAKPESGRGYKASPLYIAVNFFEATEPALTLSDREKVTMMMIGATKDMQAEPKPVSADLKVLSLALRTFRASLDVAQERLGEGQ